MLMRIIAVSICLALAALASSRDVVKPHDASILWLGGPACEKAETDTIPDRENAPKRGKTTVSRRSKDPVNIPSSSGRFRRSVFESTNLPFAIGIQYRSGWLVIEGDPSETIMRLILTAPGEKPRIYRYDGRNTVQFYIGSKCGDYKVQLLGNGVPYYRTECTFEFELVD